MSPEDLNRFAEEVFDNQWVYLPPEEAMEEEIAGEAAMGNMPCPKCGEDIAIPMDEEAYPISLECPSCGSKGKINTKIIS